ncbi:MAG: aldo/keto reductase, partial [Bacteroidales bacterium]|nr:aldo/keto reductase [Bacteroidales bacterium]
MKNLLPDDCLKLGFGLMRLPRTTGGNATGPIDIEKTKKMVDDFIAAGGRYFDTAYVYEGSEEAIREALVSRYSRESYFLATKLNAGAWAAKTEEDAKAEFQKSLQRTGAGYFDFYLLHSIDAVKLPRYDSFGIWDYVKGLQQQGLIRHWGFSFHSKPDLLDRILTEHPDTEFVQLQINYADWEDTGVMSRENYEVCVKHDVPVVVMEPVKGGMLAEPPAKVAELFKAAAPEA